MDKQTLKLLAILGGLIVLVVIVMLLSNAANSNRKYTYDEVVKEAISASKKYISADSSRKPNSTTPKRVIPLATLVDENLMKEPSELLKDDNASCYGEVDVYYLDAKKFDYIPEITCFIEGENVTSKNLVNKLIGDGDYNVVLSGSGLYKRINGKWILEEDALNSGGSDDIVEYYYRGNQESHINNYVKIDDMIFRVVMIDNNNDLLLIYNENIQKGSPWDKRYNEEINKTQGINDYIDSGIKSAAIEKVESFIAGEEKLENKTKFSESLKYIVKDMDLCIGKRKMSDTSSDGSIECQNKISGQKAGLLPAYMFMSASIDPTCEKTEDKSCGNNNYLATYSNSYWLVTSNEEKSHECYYINRSISSGVCSSNTSYKPILTIDGRVQYKEGTGTAKDPYVLETTYYKTEDSKTKKKK